MRKDYADIHVRCSAHTVQLCVKDILKSSDVVADMLKRCKDTVALFRHSVVLSDSMADTQTRLNIKVEASSSNALEQYIWDVDDQQNVM